jgi:hypothetical protein
VSESTRTALVTLGSVLLGAVIALSGSIWTQRRQIEFERENRWFEARLSTYREFDKASFNILVTLSTKKLMDPDEMDALRSALSNVAIVATDDVRLAAADVHLIAAQANKDPQQADNDALHDSFSDARAKFRRATQRELGLVR